MSRCSQAYPPTSQTSGGSGERREGTRHASPWCFAGQTSVPSGSRSFLYGVQPHLAASTARTERLDAVQERQRTAGWTEACAGQRRPQGDQRVGEPAIRPVFFECIPLLGGMTQEEAGLTLDMWLVA
jgi:hypothetical protein